jgi:hypothetical protein
LPPVRNLGEDFKLSLPAKRFLKRMCNAEQVTWPNFQIDAVMGAAIK